VVVSGKKPGREGPNEDAAAILPIDGSRVLLVVADGAGGQASASTASRLAVESIAEAVVAGLDDGVQLREAVLRGFEKANEAILERGTGAASTLAVAAIDGTGFRSFHVGDSLILVTGQRGKHKFETLAHSPVGYALEAGVIDEHEAMQHEERHLVSNMLGMPGMRIDMGPAVDLALRDTLVLATDGISDNLYPDEIVEIVRKGPLVKQAGRMRDLVGERMTAPREGVPSKPDDATFVLFRRRSR
jgi:serine/threonine protein phosphatase PrpC